MNFNFQTALRRTMKNETEGPKTRMRMQTFCEFSHGRRKSSKIRPQTILEKCH